MRKTAFTLLTLIFAIFGAKAQTITINHQLPGQPIPLNYRPGLFLVPKTQNAIDDIQNNGIHHNSIRTIDIELALNHWTVSSIADVMTELENRKNNILQVNARCDKLVLPILKMPLWLSSGTDTTQILGGFRVFNALPPADYATWNTLMDSIVDKINNQWGLDPYYEIWNEPDNGYWLGTETEYFEFYKNTLLAIKTNHPNAKVGGPTVGGFSAGLNSSSPNGYLSPEQLDSTLLGMVIDSCVSWNMPVDFVSWHTFGINLHRIEMEIAFLNQKLVSSGHGMVPFVVSEWNMGSSYRETDLHAAFMVNYNQSLVDHNIEFHQVAAWQDFDSSNAEFHGDYGILSWGALHKPAWKALLLLNDLEGTLLQVDSSDYKNLNVVSAFHNDTLKILISNYGLPGLQEATFRLYYDYQFTAQDLANSGYTAPKLDSVFRGLIPLTGTDSLSLAINSLIPTYEYADSIFQLGRDLNLHIPGILGTHTGRLININSQENNVIYEYDSLISAGYSRAAAVNQLYPNHDFDFHSISMNDSVFSFHIEPNGVSMIQLHIPEIVMSVEEEVSVGIILYPNPASEQVRIELRDQVLKKVELFDLNGKMVRSSIEDSFSVEALKPGLYFIHIFTSQGLHVAKLLKK